MQSRGLAWTSPRLIDACWCADSPPVNWLKQDAEPGQADFVAPLEVTGGERHQVAQHGLRLFLCDVTAVCQCGGEVLEGDSTLHRSLR